MAFLKNNYKKIILGVVIAIIVGNIIYGRIQSQKYANPQVFNPAKNRVVIPRVENIKDQITLAGSVRATDVANLHFNNPGKLVWIGVKVGDRVKKYQSLASLDRSQLQKSLQTQFNNYRTNLSQFTDTNSQYKDTIKTDTIKRILDRTQYSLDNSVINYEIADMAIKDSVLTSPIAGIVTDIQQPISGTFSTPADTSFTIIDPGTIYFRSEIDQETVVKVNLGQSTKISLDSFPDMPINSKITYISFTPVTGQTSTVYEVRFELPLNNNLAQYRWGMDGDATISLSESKDALTIPIDAINDDNGQKYVQVKNGDRLVRKNVKVGIENDTSSQILDGLTQNDQVVIVSR